MCTAPNRLRASPAIFAFSPFGSITSTERGTVSNIRIVKEEPRSYDLGKEARKTIAKWTFKPAMVDGKPQASRMQQEIEFAVN